MKKLLAILLTFAMCLSFAACGGADDGSSKYIPGGTRLGMTEKEIIKARSDSEYEVSESDYATENYGHTVLLELSFGNDLDEYFDFEEEYFSASTLPVAEYHLNDDGKLYSFETRTNFDTEGELEDCLNEVAEFYDELVGGGAELTEETFSLIADWETDSVKIRVEGFFFGDVYTLTVTVTDAEYDHPEYE